MSRSLSRTSPSTLSPASRFPSDSSFGRRLATRLTAWTLTAAGLALSTACTPEEIDLTLNSTLDDVRFGDSDRSGATSESSAPADRPVSGAAPRDPRGGAITDGSSNTNVLDESDDSSSDTGSQERPGRGQTPPAGDAGADEAETIRVLTQEFSNKFFEFGRSSGNSDNDAFVTGTNQLTLCVSGRFFLREQISFSGDVGFIPDPDDSIGTWAIIILEDGGPAIELRIEQTTATSQAPVLAFALAVDDAGNLFMNRARAFTFEDATGNCQP